MNASSCGGNFQKDFKKCLNCRVTSNVTDRTEEIGSLEKTFYSFTLHIFILFGRNIFTINGHYLTV